MAPGRTEDEIAQQLRSALEHFRAGRFGETEKLCRRVLGVDPDEADALYLLGLVSQQAGNSGAAIELVERASRLQPSNAFFVNSLGELYGASNRLSEAERCFRRALELEPGLAEVHNNLGNALRALGRWEQAERSYRAALAIDPGSVSARANLGTALLELKQFAQAEETFRALLALRPDSADAHNGLGVALNELGRSEEAERSYRAALALEPQFAEAHNNLGNALKDLGRAEEAAQCCRRALAIKPDYADAHLNLGLALHQLGLLDDAELCVRRALELKPNDAEAEFIRGLLRLLQGDYGTGLELYERRFDRPAAPRSIRALRSRLEGLPRWRGEDLKGKRLLIWTEQGFGDSLMSMRYLPQLKDREVRRLVVYCEPALVRVMRTFSAVDQVLSSAGPLQLGDFDCYCPSMSLPLSFGTRLESIPAQVPYLRVPAELRRAWARKLADVASPRIGLVWAGSKLPDPRRSIPLSNFFPLLGIPGPIFVSLQKGEEAAQLRESGRTVLDWMDECEDFLDTAALIEQLDLVISVDTATAHLAGALGKPVWLLNRLQSEWRWMLKREGSPWYPTMRIFRQSSFGDWDEVIARVAIALKERFGR